MRHMYDYGTTPEQVAGVKVAHSKHASNNPKAFYRKRYSVEDVVNSRIICKPLHLLDCCRNRQRDLHHRHPRRAPGSPPAAGSYSRRGRALLETAVGHAVSIRSGREYAKKIFGPTLTVSRKTSTSPGRADAFTLTMLQLEDYGRGSRRRVCQRHDRTGW